MRTTVDLPDALGRIMKIRAAREGCPLKALIARALERELSVVSEVKLPARVPSLPVLKSKRPGVLDITPDEISALLAREEAASYAADVRR
ncbi:MAG: hypothetical protein PHG96_06815 [Kiritimatiellae bacterium]|nr:hypothetical protein [Kiritimatiellia bacterium]MDD3545055.1 hypothetical protein [Kiritimatiellia bacterium]MDD4026521.1 hypothetical protein [Kiritimatiellia bacterium]MDD4622005.1 hypothetical protein [Kiritimatiellia bacterium]